MIHTCTADTRGLSSFQMMKGAANTRPRYITMGQRTDCFTSCSDRNCHEPGQGI